MKKKLILLTFLVSVFFVFVGVRFFIFDKQNMFGKLKVIATPSASVFIDNVAIGRTPYEDKYKIGDYVLKLIPEGNATETASWQGKIKINRNALTYVNRELGSSDITSAGEIFTTSQMEKAPMNPSFGEIYVETEPQGAIVYLDNDEKGVASVVLQNVLKGDHELSVSMPGFFRRTQKINVDAGFRVNSFFKLAIDQSQKQVVKQNDSKEASASAKITKSIRIKDTPTGWLRVRADASVDASESAKVKPGEKFELLDEREGWFKIKYDGKEGWISSQYAEKE